MEIDGNDDLASMSLHDLHVQCWKALVGPPEGSDEGEISDSWSTAARLCAEIEHRSQSQAMMTLNMENNARSYTATLIDKTEGDEEEMDVDLDQELQASDMSMMSTSPHFPSSGGTVSMESANPSPLNRTQIMESPVESTVVSSGLVTVNPPELVRNTRTSALSEDFSNAFGLPFAPQRSPRTPQNSQDAPQSPDRMMEATFEATEAGSNSSDNSSDIDVNMRRRPTRSLGDDELCYAGDESSGIESPAMKRMNLKTANRRKLETKESSNSLDDSTDNETRRRYYPNPYYQPAGPNKANERAIRFNTTPRPAAPESERNNKIPDNEKLFELFNELGMQCDYFDDEELKTLNKTYRLDSLLVRGTQKMSSDDIFRYFLSNHQNPIKMEWINDMQCVVIFDDMYEAGACLLNMTKPIDTDAGGRKTDEDEVNYEALEVIPAREVFVAMPQTHVWRYAVPCPGTRGIIMSIAKKSDKKQQNAEEASEYYRTHGNPNRGDGIYTKKTYDQHHRPRRQVTDANSSSTVQRFSEYKPPIHTRLGVARKRGPAMDEEGGVRRGAKVSRNFQRSRSSQHVSLYERTHGDSSSDLDYPYRQHEEEEVSDNQSYGSSRQSTTYEDEEDEDLTPSRAYSYHDRRGNNHGFDRNAGGGGGGSIKSRLGW